MGAMHMDFEASGASTLCYQLGHDDVDGGFLQRVLAQHTRLREGADILRISVSCQNSDPFKSHFCCLSSTPQSPASEQSKWQKILRKGLGPIMPEPLSQTEIWGFPSSLPQTTVPSSSQVSYVVSFDIRPLIPILLMIFSLMCMLRCFVLHVSLVPSKPGSSLDPVVTSALCPKDYPWRHDTHRRGQDPHTSRPRPCEAVVTFGGSIYRIKGRCRCTSNRIWTHSRGVPCTGGFFRALDDASFYQSEMRGFLDIWVTINVILRLISRIALLSIISIVASSQGGAKFAGYEYWKKALVEAVGGQKEAVKYRTAIYLGGASIAECVFLG